jgi:hypothetical protein
LASPRNDAAKKSRRSKISSSFSLTGYLPLYSSACLPTFLIDRRQASDFLRVSRMQRRLTPSQPKFDTTKKDRIARMYWFDRSVALRERIDVAVA